MRQMQQEASQVTKAYEYCRQVTQHASKTFYWGSVFLPPAKRRAIWAVYAFCRKVDDAVDEVIGDLAPRNGHLSGSCSPQKVLDEWRESLTQLYRGTDMTADPVLCAWYDMLEHYHVPLQPALDLLDGVEMDFTKNRYQTFDELYLYCYRVAGTVGLLTAPIFGYQDECALPYAVDLGVALQLTNILRDIGEDAQRNRIYIPLEELTRFGYSESELMSGCINDAFRDLLTFQMARANDYYAHAQPGIPLLDADCRLAVRLSGTLYHSILDRIRLNGYNVFTRRASVPLQSKLMTVSHHWFAQQFETVFGGIH
jgi:15-cis-phytoene synthase